MIETGADAFGTFAELTVLPAAAAGQYRVPVAKGASAATVDGEDLDVLLLRR